MDLPSSSTPNSLKRSRSPSTSATSSQPHISALSGIPLSDMSSSPKRAMSEDDLEERQKGNQESSALRSEVGGDEELPGMDVDMDDLPVQPAEERKERIPSLREQLEIIEAGIARAVAPDEQWYLLPSSWLRTLRTLTTTSPSKSETSTVTEESLVRPDVRPLINRTLYESRGTVLANGEGMFFGTLPAQGAVHSAGWRVRDNLVDGEEGDMVYIPASTWKKIVKWHGNSRPEGGVLRSTQSNANGEMIIEVNPPTMIVHRVVQGEAGERSRPFRITTSKYDQISDLHDEARKALNIDKTTPTRIWKLEMPPWMLVDADSRTSPTTMDDAQTAASIPLPTRKVDEDYDSASPMDIEPPSYPKPPGYTMTVPAREVPARRLPTLSAKLLGTRSDGNSTDGSSGLENDPLVEDALLENGDCLAVEVGRKTDNGIEWMVGVNEQGLAEEKETSTASKRAPLFSTQFTFGGQSTSTSASTSKMEDAKKANGIVTRSQAVAGSSRGKTRGLKGLQNLGNTCFMNSALQCLSNTKELSEYFQSDEYRNEVNYDNPLGMHGKVALAFGNLIKEIWDGGSSNSYYGNSVNPREFKHVIGKFAPSFAGYGQQDTQELLAFLLDGLHEDLNRIQKKPYIEKPDWKDGGTDDDLARMGKECWEGYKKRNDSIIVDLFQGQLKSTLICPDCHKKSITLDPFMYLTVPIPVTKSFVRRVYFKAADPRKTAQVLDISLKMDAPFSVLKQKVSRLVGVPANKLLAIDQFNHRIYAYWPDDKAVHEARSNDVIVLHEVAVPVSQSEQGTRTLDPTTIVVPVFMTTQQRAFGHPMFVALNKQQRTEVMSICRAVVNACMALVREDKADGLFASSPAAEGDAATSTSPSPRSQKLKTGLYELFIEKQNRFTINKRSSGMFSGEPGNNQETLGDRLKPKLMNRITNGLSGMISSAPNSDDEDEGAKPLIWPSEAITLDWKPEAANEFFGHDRLGRYATDRDYEHVEDPDIATERQKEGRKGTLSLDDCLNEFSKPEVLGEHDLWYCSNCKEHKAATKRMEIYQVPDILVICIKRFSGSGYRSNKMGDTISFPANGLSLDDRCDEKRVAQVLRGEGKDLAEYGLERALEPLVYDLYAVDNHFGGLGGGHYTATCKNFEDGKWYNYDDSRVSPAGEGDISGSAAYLLFYRKRTTRSIGGRFRDKVEAALSSRGVSPAPSIPRPVVPADIGSSLSSTPQIDTAPASPLASSVDGDRDNDHDMDSSRIFHTAPIRQPISRDDGYDSDKTQDSFAAVASE